MEEDDFNLSINELNALFFGDISKLSSKQFIKLFEHKHNLSVTTPEKDFGNQITNNAEICVQKFAYFKIAGWITFSAFILGATLVVVKAFI